MGHVTDKRWQGGWGAEKCLLNLSSHTDTSISQESFHIFSFSVPRRCDGGKTWCRGSKRRAERGRDSPRPGWRSSGRASMQRDKRVKKTQGYLGLDKVPKVNSYRLPSLPALRKEACQMSKLAPVPSHWFPWHTLSILWMGPSELTDPMAGPTTHPGCCSYPPPSVSPKWALLSFLTFPPKKSETWVKGFKRNNFRTFKKNYRI